MNHAPSKEVLEFARDLVGELDRMFIHPYNHNEYPDGIPFVNGFNTGVHAAAGTIRKLLNLHEGNVIDGQVYEVSTSAYSTKAKGSDVAQIAGDDSRTQSP